MLNEPDPIDFLILGDSFGNALANSIVSVQIAKGKIAANEAAEVAAAKLALQNNVNPQPVAVDETAKEVAKTIAPAIKPKLPKATVITPSIVDDPYFSMSQSERDIYDENLVYSFNVDQDFQEALNLDFTFDELKFDDNLYTDISNWRFDSEQGNSGAGFWSQAWDVTKTVSGALAEGLVNVVYQPIAQTLDLAELVYAIGYNTFSDDTYELTGFSNASQATDFTSGLRASFEYNAVGGVFYGAFDSTTAFGEGDLVTGSINALGTVAGIFGAKGLSFGDDLLAPLRSLSAGTRTELSEARRLAISLNDKFSSTGVIDYDQVDQLATLSTARFLDSNGALPDRLVLGAWEADPSYVALAKRDGGTIFDLPDGAWGDLTNGLGKGSADARKLAWAVNRQVLDNEMQRGISKIDYVTADPFIDLVAAPNTFRAQEIRHIILNSERYGYQIDGSSWFKTSN